MTITKTATVLTGSRIEFDAPELAVGQCVDITITVRTTTPATNESAQQGIADFLRTRLPSNKSLAEWDTFERNFQTEKDAWDLPSSP